MRAQRIRAGLVVLGAFVLAAPIAAVGCAQAALEDTLTPLDSGAADTGKKPVADAGIDHNYGNASDTGTEPDTTGGGEDVDSSVPDTAPPVDVTVPDVSVPIEASVDTGVDAPVDTGIDAPVDTGVDAPIDAGFDSGCPVACGPQMACVVGACTAARRVFVSSVGYTGNLGGALGADASCQALATAASLGGTWMAWVSDSTTSPSARFTKSTDPYRLLDGTLVASSWTSLVSSSLSHAINLDEHLALVSNSEVWTATLTSGTLYSAGCSGFTAAVHSSTVEVGHTAHADSLWSGVYPQFCDRTDPRLYCFEQ